MAQLCSGSKYHSGGRERNGMGWASVMCSLNLIPFIALGEDMWGFYCFYINLSWSLFTYPLLLGYGQSCALRMDQGLRPLVSDTLFVFHNTDHHLKLSAVCLLVPCLCPPHPSLVAISVEVLIHSCSPALHTVETGDAQSV